MNLRIVFLVLALAAALPIPFAIVLRFKGLGIIPGLPFMPMQNIVGWCMAGMACGGLLLVTSLARHPIRMVAPLCVLAVLSLTLAHLDMVSWTVPFFFNGMLLPLLTQSLLRESTRSGLHLGMALGGADCFWNFIYVLPTPPTDSMLVSFMVLLQAAVGILFIFGQHEYAKVPGDGQQTGTAAAMPATAAASALFAGVQRHETPSVSLAHEYLPLLCLTAFFFFTLNVLVYTPVEAATQGGAVARVLSLYLWVVYPLAGLYLDWQGHGSRFLLLCLGGTVLSVVCGHLITGVAGPWFAGAFAQAARKAALICLFFLTAQADRSHSFFGFAVTLPALALLCALWLFNEATSSFTHSFYFVLLAIFLACTTLYCCARLSLLLEKLHHDLPENTQRRVVRPLCPSLAFEVFAEKYSLSTREQDVLRLIVDGLDTTTIGLTLHISEHTIKSHVRQLLRKTQTRNRINLAALFFNETGNSAVA